MSEDASENELEAIENAVRSLLDEQNDIEDRILSARHLGASSDEHSFDALLEVCKAPDGNDDLYRAAARSLKRVAAELGRESEIKDENLTVTAGKYYRDADA